MFEAEYFSLQSWYSKKMGDTIRFLEKDWDTVRLQVQGMSFYDLFDVARMVGGGRKRKENMRRYQIMWPREMAWAFMSTDGSKVVCDCVEVNMPLSWKEFNDPENNYSQGDLQGARFCSNYLHCLRFQPRFPRKALTALAAFRKFMDFCRQVGATKIFLRGMPRRETACAAGSSWQTPPLRYRWTPALTGATQHQSGDCDAPD